MSCTNSIKISTNNRKTHTHIQQNVNDDKMVRTIKPNRNCTKETQKAYAFFLAFDSPHWTLSMSGLNRVINLRLCECIWNGIWIWRAYYSVLALSWPSWSSLPPPPPPLHDTVHCDFSFFIDSERNFHTVPFQTEFDRFMRFACGKLITSEIRFYYSSVHHLHPHNQNRQLVGPAQIRSAYTSIGVPESTNPVHSNSKNQNGAENRFWNARTTPASLPMNPFHFWPRLERTNRCNWPEIDLIFVSLSMARKKQTKNVCQMDWTPNLTVQPYITRPNAIWTEFDFETLTDRFIGSNRFNVQMCHFSSWSVFITRPPPTSATKATITTLHWAPIDFNPNTVKFEMFKRKNINNWFGALMRACKRERMRPSMRVGASICISHRVRIVKSEWDRVELSAIDCLSRSIRACSVMSKSVVLLPIIRFNLPALSIIANIISPYAAWPLRIESMLPTTNGWVQKQRIPLYTAHFHWFWLIGPRDAVCVCVFMCGFNSIEFVFAGCNCEIGDFNFFRLLLCFVLFVFFFLHLFDRFWLKALLQWKE